MGASKELYDEFDEAVLFASDLRRLAKQAEERVNRIQQKLAEADAQVYDYGGFGPVGVYENGYVRYFKTIDGKVLYYNQLIDKWSWIDALSPTVGFMWSTIDKSHFPIVELVGSQRPERY